MDHQSELAQLTKGRILERMLLALNAPITDANIAKLSFFAGVIYSINTKAEFQNLDLIESMITGIDIQTAQSRCASD